MTERPKPRFEYVDITPELADEWLARNVINRNLKQGSIDAYMRDFASDSWPDTAEPIKLCWFGNLLDGQHRLTAIKKLGITKNLVVAFGLDPAVQKYLDSGVKRSAADMLRMMGNTTNPVAVASAARLAILMERRRSAPVDFKVRGATHPEIYRFLEEHPDFADICDNMATYTHIHLIPSVKNYVGWRLFDLDADAARKFFHGLNSLSGMDEDDPRLILSRRLSRALVRPPRDETLAMIFRTWNAYRTGRPLNLLRIQLDARNRIRIPEPV